MNYEIYFFNFFIKKIGVTISKIQKIIRLPKQENTKL